MLVNNTLKHEYTGRSYKRTGINSITDLHDMVHPWGLCDFALCHRTTFCLIMDHCNCLVCPWYSPICCSRTSIFTDMEEIQTKVAVTVEFFVSIAHSLQFFV